MNKRMKFNLNIFFALLISALFFITSCGEPKPEGLVIDASFAGAENLKAYFDQRDPVSQNVEILDQTDIDANGDFTFEMKEKQKAGIYRIRIGSQETPVLLTGDEEKITMKGNLNQLKTGNYTLEGAPALQEYIDILQGLTTKQLQLDQFVERIETTEYPLSAALLSQQALRGSTDYVDTYEKISANLESTYPDLEFNDSYSKFVSQVKRKKQQEMASQKIKVGEKAPEISLENPEGEEMSLSDTRGKIVLLDFWASWCGPCRKANPKVVRIYDKYKDQGFTVFSVSFDGVDSRTARRLGSEERIENYKEKSKQRWINAIEKDNLKWDWHVSDLKKWDSSAAGTYGVTAIPKTFLIDRDGKIAAVNPRNNLEEELKKLL